MKGGCGLLFFVKKVSYFFDEIENCCFKRWKILEETLANLETSNKFHEFNKRMNCQKPNQLT